MMLFNSAATLLNRCSSHWLSRERDTPKVSGFIINQTIEKNAI
jgi:hypothetical protein